MGCMNGYLPLNTCAHQMCALVHLLLDSFSSYWTVCSELFHFQRIFHLIISGLNAVIRFTNSNKEDYYCIILVGYYTVVTKDNYVK